MKCTAYGFYSITHHAERQRGYSRKWREKMDVMKVTRKIQTHLICYGTGESPRHCTQNLFATFCVDTLKMTKSLRARVGIVCVRVLFFLTCGSRAVVVWRWECRQPASSAGGTASGFWSPASGRSSGRSCERGSPYTRCAPTPGSPDEHKEADGGKKDTM